MSSKTSEISLPAEIASAVSKIKDKYGFSSENLPDARHHYVAWVDIMGASSLMTTSTQKTANAIGKLHIVVSNIVEESNNVVDYIAINDGAFLFAESKTPLMAALQKIFASLAGIFLATHSPANQFLVRGCIAFGPLHKGASLQQFVKYKKVRDKVRFSSLLFGAPIAQAYRGESFAAPFGIYIDESARSFASDGDKPFQLLHWLWWQKVDGLDLPNGYPPLHALKNCLSDAVEAHLNFVANANLQYTLKHERLVQLKNAAKQYFFLG